MEYLNMLSFKHMTEYYTIIKMKVINNLFILYDGILNKCMMQSYMYNMIKTIKLHVDLFTKNRFFLVM